MNYMGIDVGSTTVKLIVINENNDILFSEYMRHYSDIKNTVKNLFEKAKEALGDTSFTAMITGSGGLLVSKMLGIDFVQEVIATKAAVKRFLPDTDVVIELGGEDAKILYLTNGLEQRMNGTCAGGTGSFIDQMALLLKTDATGLNELAKKHTHIYKIAARCGVFAKSDVQPLLNEGAAREDVAASVLQAVVTQTISGLAQGRAIKGNVVFLGGPLFFLSELRERFKQTLSDKAKSFKSPDNAQLFVALGAAISAEEQKDTYTTSELLKRLQNAKEDSHEVVRMRPLFKNDEEYKEFKLRHEKASVERADIEDVKGATFFGIDVGSTTIKAALIDENCRLIFSFYGKNEGSPIISGIKILKDLYQKLPEGAYIANACATGYGEQLIKAAFRINEGEIETIAHYKAANFFRPGVDFIIDIGGQDMKCMKITNGVIDSIMLNEACSSGCGSFIQTFAESLGYSVEEFAKEALKGENPIDLGTRCTVFMNSRVKQAQKEGATVGDISAGLSYSVVRNAMYKVIKLRDPELMGEKVVVQGGTFNNDSVLRAFEIVSKKQVVRPDIAGIMGAFGSALIAKERYVGGKSDILKADELEAFQFSNTLTNCGLCPNHCQLTITSFADGKKYISGNRCEKGAGNTKSEKEYPNLYKYKYERAFDYPPLLKEEAKRGTIGIPRALNIYENYPLWATFFKELGFRVEISKRSSHSLYEKGMESIPSESVCYPAKLAHGHIMDLLSRGIKNIFYPCVPYEQTEYKGAGNHYNCPIVTSYPEVIYNNIEMLRSPDIKFIYPFVNLDDEKSFVCQMAEALIDFNVTKKEVKKASQKAFCELKRYKSDIRKKGEEVLLWLSEHNEHGIVLAGRPYHIDPEINHGIPEMINSLGFAVLTEDSVAHLGNMERDIRVVDQWAYHTRLYEAAAEVLKNESLELIQLNSFGCGLDAVTTDQVQEILESAQKIYTTLKIDEISSLGTARIRARSLKAAIREREENSFVAKKVADYTLKRVPFTKKEKQEHTIIFPQMSPTQFKLFEAVMRVNGYRGVVLDKVTPADVEAGLKSVNNDACYPSIIVTGQLVNAFVSGKYDPKNTSVMITQTGGGCRATNYIAFLRKALAEAGYPDVPVISLNLSGLEKNPGFKLTPSLIYDLIKSCVLGDLLMTCLLATRPYELSKGKTNELYNEWLERLYMAILKREKLPRKKISEAIIEDFSKIPIDKSLKKPKVGVVGEILVKFHPGANNNVIDVIEKEGGEAVMPGLLDFFLYSMYNNNFKSEKLGFSKKTAMLCNIAIAAMEKYRMGMIKTLKNTPRFKDRISEDIASIAEGAKRILKLGHFTGEGWFLTGEMIELIKSGVPNIVCVQPFACLPNHVTGKGMIKEIRRKFPEANIVAVDYDPGASEVNQLNRIKLMMAVAFENLEEASYEKIEEEKREEKSPVLKI